VERGLLTGYGDREIEDSISMTEFAKTFQRVYSYRCGKEMCDLKKKIFFSHPESHISQQLVRRIFRIDGEIFYVR